MEPPSGRILCLKMQSYLVIKNSQLRYYLINDEVRNRAYCEENMINLSRFSFFNYFYLHLLSTGNLTTLSEKAQNFSNLIALQQSVQVKDNWILLLNSYILPELGSKSQFL